MNIKIIYWSGTGNTKEIAEFIEKGARETYSKVKCLEVSKANLEDVESADILVLGCPSMGDEVLEESQMEPFMESIEDKIKGKKLALFGSYGWGDGKWMRDWEARVKDKGAQLVKESLIINYSPDGLEDDCIEFGKSL